MKIAISILNQFICYLKIARHTGVHLNFKNKLNFKNEDCYILGNGPSLNSDLTERFNIFHNQNLLVVNDFSLSPFYEKLKPKFYFFADPAYWNDNLPPRLAEKINETKNNILKKTNWNIKIIIPFSARRVFDELPIVNKNIEVYYFNNIPFETETDLDFLLYSKYLAAPHMQNVLVGAIYFAVNSGFKNIFLFGADHSWLPEIRVNNDNQVCLIDKHFYDLDEPKLVPWLKANDECYTVEEILRDLAKMFSGYSIVKRYALKKGTNIYNCTPNSFIDSFERVSI